MTRLILVLLMAFFGACYWLWQHAPEPNLPSVAQGRPESPGLGERATSRELEAALTRTMAAMKDGQAPASSRLGSGEPAVVFDMAARIEERYRRFPDSRVLSVWIIARTEGVSELVDEVEPQVRSWIQEDPVSFLESIGTVLRELPADAEEERSELAHLVAIAGADPRGEEAANAIIVDFLEPSAQEAAPVTE